jgi:glycosyltransferase involved in cell wall biosynthesis
MKALHLCTSEAWGGLELYACTIMAELQKRGVDVVGICAAKSKAEEFLSDHGVRTASFPSQRLLSLQNIRFLHQLISSEHIDVVHAHFHKDVGPASITLTADRSKIFLLSVYMGVVKKMDPYHRFIYSRTDAIFTSSRRLAVLLPERYPVPSSKIHYLPYGRKIENYRTDPATRARIRQSFGCAEHDLLAGTMVRIDPGKGVMDFAKSISYVLESSKRPIKYCIVGEPTRRAHQRPDESPYEAHCLAYLREIERFIREQGLQEKILLTGFQNDSVGFLSAMDLFVFPSRDELYSLAVLDAMAMGLPVIAAAAGGNVDQVQAGQTGYLFPVGDIRSMAEYILLYAGSDELRRVHGEKGRDFVREHHSMDNSINELLGYYTMKSEG